MTTNISIENILDGKGTYKNGRNNLFLTHTGNLFLTHTGKTFLHRNVAYIVFQGRVIFTGDILYFLHPLFLLEILTGVLIRTSSVRPI